MSLLPKDKTHTHKEEGCSRIQFSQQSFLFYWDYSTQTQNKAWNNLTREEPGGATTQYTHTKHTVYVMYQTPVTDIQDTRGRKVALLCYLISWYCCYEKHQLVLAFMYTGSKEDLCEYQSCGELWPEAPCSTILSAALLVSQQGGERGASSSSKYIKNENK